MNLPAFTTTADGRQRKHLEPRPRCALHDTEITCGPFGNTCADCESAAFVPKWQRTFAESRPISETDTIAKPACEKCGQPAACKLDRRWLCSSCGCAALEADDTPVEGIARLRVDDHPIPPLVKGGQGREVHCSPALAVLILIAAIAVPVVVVLAVLARGA